MAEQQTASPSEATKSCAGCKKPVKKLRRFYRNGKFYCSSNCYRKTAKEKKSSAAEGAAPATA